MEMKWGWMFRQEEDFKRHNQRNSRLTQPIAWPEAQSPLEKYVFSKYMNISILLQCNLFHIYFFFPPHLCNFSEWHFMPLVSTTVSNHSHMYTIIAPEASMHGQLGHHWCFCKSFYWFWTNKRLLESLWAFGSNTTSSLFSLISSHSHSSRKKITHFSVLLVP